MTKYMQVAKCLKAIPVTMSKKKSPLDFTKGGQ